MYHHPLTRIRIPMTKNEICNNGFHILDRSIKFVWYSPHFYTIVCATLMTENRQQVVSGKSHLMIAGLSEKNPAPLPETLDSGT